MWLNKYSPATQGAQNFHTTASVPYLAMLAAIPLKSTNFQTTVTCDIM